MKAHLPQGRAPHRGDQFRCTPVRCPHTAPPTLCAQKAASQSGAQRVVGAARPAGESPACDASSLVQQRLPASVLRAACPLTVAELSLASGRRDTGPHSSPRVDVPSGASRKWRPGAAEAGVRPLAVNAVHLRHPDALPHRVALGPVWALLALTASGRAPHRSGAGISPRAGAGSSSPEPLGGKSCRRVLSVGACPTPALRPAPRAPTSAVAFRRCVLSTTAPG